MTFQLGRLTMDDPQEWDQSGDEVSASGFLYADSIHELQAMRQQLLGHVNNRDEPVVPVVASNDSHVDGFYRVTGGSVGVPRGGHKVGEFEYTLRLQRVSDYSAPLIESILQAPTVRTNDNGVDESDVSAGRYWMISGAVRGLNVQATPFDMPVEDGSDNVLTSAMSSTSQTKHYTFEPSEWYHGACKLEVDYADDATFRPVVGRQVINLGLLGGAADTGRWRLSNGAFRITETGTSTLGIGLSRWDSSGWTTPKEFAFTRTTDDTTMSAPHTLNILRNSQHEMIVRLTGGGVNSSGGNLNHYRLDLRLVRGYRHVEVVASMVRGTTFDWQLGRATTDAGAEFNVGTSSNVGVADGSTDADDMIWFIMTPQSYTADTTNGRVGLGVETAGRFAFGLGSDVFDGPGITTGESAVERAGEQYFSAIAETVRVVEQ